ncbi:DUF6992 family protein [Mucilaginibacter sp. McL0603]|uniref:DUF6992 family protein n=1 Tax=Mucilaginibacter sp. McL0603 TaxID=3415670 RepID=UPI003CF58129
MKKALTIILILFSAHAFAQDSLKIFNKSRISITSSGMEVLGGWGILNLGTGAIGWANSTNLESRYFFEMNTIWGAADFGVALIGYGGLQKQRKKTFTAAETLEEQKRIEKIFFINGILDVAYIGTGLYLKLEGDSRNSPIMKGYGESILIQGGFLLIFDGVMYHAEKTNGNKLRSFLEKHPITFDGKRVGMVFNM